MSVFIGALPVLATPKLTVGTVLGFPGATVHVPVRLSYGSNDLRNVVALQADVLQTGAASAGALTGGNALSGHVIASSQPASNLRRLLVYSLNNALITNGTVLSVPYTIPIGSIQNVQLELNNVVLATADGFSVPVTTVSGGIAVTPVFVRSDGDVNGYFILNTNTPPGLPLVIQASTNLVHWVNVATNVSEESIRFYFDQDAHLYPHRFYRPVPLGGELSGLTWLGESGLNFKVTGAAGRSYVIQASTNLQDWLDLSTNLVGSGSLWFTNRGGAYQFFRLKSE